MADVLLRLHAYTADDHWRDQARAVLAGWVTHYEEHGLGAAPFGAVLLRYLDWPDHIVVIGRRNDPGTQRLHGAALVTPRPLRTVQLLDPSDAADAARAAAAGFDLAVRPAAPTLPGPYVLAVRALSAIQPQRGIDPGT